MAKIDQLLTIVTAANASDLHMVSGSAPMIRANGVLQKTKHRDLSNEDIKQLMYELLSDDQIRLFEKNGDFDFAYGTPRGRRFRINVYKSQHGIAAAIRLIPSKIQTLTSLGFSEHVASLAELKSGLVLVTGPTNSGKTTTLASMVEHINTNFSRHIIALEDPIEYVHQNKNSLISQRQIGLHSQSFAAALKSALREDPDVILVGEMRDLETISLAVSAAEIGLLVMGTLHTSTASATIDRILDVFPSDQQAQIRIMVAESLAGIISQQLLRRADGNGRVVAYELMVKTMSISTMIREGKTYQIPTAIQTGSSKGMRLLDSHLKALVETGQIKPDEALRYAVDPGKLSEHFHQETPLTVGA